MVAFCTFLPFALFPYLEWWTLPAMYVFTFLLFGIENIGGFLHPKPSFQGRGAATAVRPCTRGRC